MKHYDHVEWIFYKNNVLSEEKMIEMEEHLYYCDECLETFLSLIDENEVEEAIKPISEEFTNKIMDEIEKVEYLPRVRTNRTNRRHKEILTYYIAVASVTIVLTVGGFFTRLVDTVPIVVQSSPIVDNIELPNKVADISGKIVNKTSDFINRIEISNIKEDGNERKK